MPKLLTAWGYADTPGKNVTFDPSLSGLDYLAKELFTVGPGTNNSRSITAEAYEEYAALAPLSPDAGRECCFVLAGVLYAKAKTHHFLYWRIEPEYSEWDANDNFDTMTTRTETVEMWAKVYMRCLFSNVDWRTLEGNHGRTET